MSTTFQALDTLGQGGMAINRSPTVPKDIVQPDYSDSGQGTNTGMADDQVVNPATDTRVRLRAMINQEDQVYGDPTDSDNILAIMHPRNADKHGTNGLLFPYTPSISFGQSVNYKSLELIHTNGGIEAYVGTPNVDIDVTGTFTVQNQREGQYALAVLHFLRTVSKMYFGEKVAKSNAGLPPPVLIFNGYGNYMFNNLPVILTSHSYSLDKEANMISINTASGLARLPAKFEVQMKLKVQQTPRAMRQDFDLEEFRTGKLMRSGNDTGWI